jgi:hypothetical protein
VKVGATKESIKAQVVVATEVIAEQEAVEDAGVDESEVDVDWVEALRRSYMIGCKSKKGEDASVA